MGMLCLAAALTQLICIEVVRGCIAVRHVQIEQVRDVVAHGYGLGAAVDAVLLMNILHCEAAIPFF